jgi:hypothetical protein
MEYPMQRLISLFAAVEHEPQLAAPAAGPPPDPHPPDYDREPEYFRHLLAYLRDQKRAERDVEAIDEAEGVLA